MENFRMRLSSFLVLAAILGLLLGFQGCSNDESSLTTPITQAPQDNSPDLRGTMVIQERHTPALMASPDVIGTAVTLGEDGQPAILVLVTSEKAVTRMPMDIDGVQVQILLTDPIVAMRTTVPTVSHTAVQTLPVQLGTSGGWRYDLANGYCCGGTLGSLIQVGSQQRILSNYHVFEADIVSGGNSRVATTGDYVIQPGLIDIGCNAANAQNVATLVVSHSLPNSNVDASTATIIPGAVSSSILEIGMISSQTVAAAVNQAVKKSGRTTGLTRSTVSGLNATISVAYENECAGGAAFTKTYTGQIVVANKRSKFLAGGDSGSLLVQDVATNPRAVGLLFAGSTTTAIANPIAQVLSFFGATMVGN